MQSVSQSFPFATITLRLELDTRHHLYKDHLILTLENYREPVPTKKDKTMVEILDLVKSIEANQKSIEGKVDRIDRIFTNRPPASSFGSLQTAPSSQPLFSAEADLNSYATPSLRSSHQQSPAGVGRSQPYRHASAAHKILTWPSIQQLLLQGVPANIGDLKSLEREGSAFIVR